MDADALRIKGLEPQHVQPVRVRGMRLRIGRRAALEESRDGITHGFLLELSHAEIERLYADPAVAVYRPEAVTAERADGSTVAALCYNLPSAPAADERNPEYAAKLRALATRLQLPADYIES